MNKETQNRPIFTYRGKSIDGNNLMEGNNIYEKNILVLVREIQENEKKIEENKKGKKNFTKTSQNIYPKIKLTPLNNLTIQYILSCRLRTKNMLKILNAFLSSMKMFNLAMI